MPTASKPLRADAERNRQAIICAAGEVFASEGTDVTLEQIAHAAGVGVGTVYRRFSSIQDLAAVVLEEKMRNYADCSEEAAERALTDPWNAFRDYVMSVLEEQASDIAFSEVITSGDGATELFRTHQERALSASKLLAERAKAAGAIRPDFQHNDLLIFISAARGVLLAPQCTDPDAWKRLAEYLLDAARAGARESEPPRVDAADNPELPESPEGGN